MGRLGLPELVILLIIVFIPYFLPTIIAIGRRKANVMAIALVNVFFGWTIIGWFVALVWAASRQVVDQQPVAAPAVVGASPALCAQCGKYNAPGLKFCGHCGAALL